MGFIHAGGGERGEGIDGAGEAVGIGEEPGEQRSDREACIAPEPVDADRGARQAGWAMSPMVASRVG